MVHKDKRNISLTLIHRLTLYARQMAYQEEKHSKIASFLDDIEYLQALFLSEKDFTETFHKYLIAIGQQYGYEGLVEEFIQEDNLKEEVKRNKENISQKKYNFEIKIKYLKEKTNLLIELKAVESLITDSKILGKAIEHDSVHYVEYIYFKWQIDELKVKLYIDDYSQNSLCFDISSLTAKISSDVTTKIVKLLESELSNIEIAKKLEIN